MKSTTNFRALTQSAVAMIVATFAFVACSDYDNGYTEQSIAYDEQFTNLFGQIDPNQDWSMAAYVSAKVAVPNAGQGSTVEIYTDVPVFATTKLLTRATVNGSDIQFNVVKGTEQVYAIVRSNGKVLAKGYYDIQNGETINITDKPVAKRAAKMLTTRFGDGSSVTKGWLETKDNTTFSDKDNYPSFASLSDMRYSWKGSLYTLEELIQWAIDNRCNQYNYAPFNDDCIVPAHWDFTNATINTNMIEQVGDDQYKFKYGENYGKVFTWDELMKMTIEEGNPYNAPLNNCWIEISVDFTKATVDANQAPSVGVPQYITFTHLEGVETEAAEPWHLALGYELFGPGSFFMERQRYFGEHKMELYGDTEDEKLKMLQEIENGFSIVTTGGEIDIPFIYGATDYANQFGYVYFREGQDPLEQPHYILMDDASPTGNIFFTEWGNSENAVGGMQLSGWREDSDDEPLWGYPENTYIYGTKYRLAFFGENHDETATYDFPAGYHMVFFVKTDVQGNYTYSLPSLNERTNRLYGNTTSLTYEKGIAPAGAVKATAWEANGMTFLGFEDGGGDEDLNDIVFWVEGEFYPDTEIPDLSVDDEIDPQTWIFACEDLGGSFDYDFNDVVWEAVQTFEGDDQTGWTINILAAGGTLPVELWYNDQQICEDVHKAYGQELDGGLYTPINVGEQATEAPLYVKTIPTTTQKEHNIDNIYRNFKVKVKKSNENSFYVTAPQKDGSTAPQIILLPGEWLWPQESTPISTAYNNFSRWVHDAEWRNWIHGAPNYKNYTTRKYQQ